jgi:hypothetical protein
MLEQLAKAAEPILNIPAVRRTRRNHGLEHATIHILSNRVKGLQMAGRSDDSGFVLLGDAPTESIEQAVNDALRRMQNGEHSLAIHPNCGTNLVTTGLLTSLTAMVGMGGLSRRESWNRMPAVMIMMMFTVLFSQPLGLSLQKHFTTEGDPGNLEVISVTRKEMRTPLSTQPMTVHRVSTKSS